MPDIKTITLRVKEHIPLPHVMTVRDERHVFAPDEELEAGYAKHLLDLPDSIFMVAKGDPDMSKYQFKKDYESKVLQDVITSLTKEQEMKVVKFIDGLQQEDAKKKAAQEKIADKELQTQNKTKGERELAERKKAEADEKTRAAQSPAPAPAPESEKDKEE